ncbi:hypothetical protein JR316_0006976 [Psilocybe cubensis]|uniref:SUN domain-containing protein n=2 Tax=Psilocybe cubensis TaxID=181762 RepID=A0A8H8CMB5_PSICU|nr:hypothetical protein JR316_0006976 [Psilocybe cubensis]KAH9480378.1 hypothetical protein JR316_0006976 [Psilocybe cubensis]
MLSVLPVSLLLLLFASPVFSVQPTSSYDSFRALSLQKPQQPDNPICCLKPLTPLEPVDDGILLSFEEWKMKQLATQSAGFTTGTFDKDANIGSPQVGDGVPANDVGSTGSESTVPPVDTPAPSGFNSPDQVPSGPHFRVPLTDRFNYASLDCSARVHTAHRSAKSPSAILSSKRDRYMLSPCDKSKENQFVVVELCDDIRIDTVQLANFEFFSGVFKDFTVSVAKNYDPDGWTPVATYRAKNVRGVQSFHPPRSLRDFYRFIRIDFLSNYGNEFYCPVSLLRVYGLTHLEEWKWDVWELESKSKQEELKRKRQRVIEPIAIPEPIVVPHTAESSINTSNRVASTAEDIEKITTPPVNADAERTADTPPPTQSQIQNTSNILSSQHSYRDSTSPTGNDYHKSIPSQKANDDLFTQTAETPVPSPISSSIPSASDANRQTQHIPPSMPESSSTGTSLSSPPSQANNNVQYTVASSSSDSSSGTPIIITSGTPSSAIIPSPPMSSHLAVKGGENIYRTIMNRLAEVELNQTLYVRYIEQQNLAVREAIKRLGEDVGRLEGISRAQSLTYQRTLAEWEKQRYQLEMEYGDLVSRIEYLSQEIILEKRLGVAQLCLLLAVLIFLGLTRGSRAEAIIDHGSHRLNQSVREWGKRHFKLSGDWAGRFKGKDAVNTEKQSSSSRSRSRSRSRSTTSRSQTPMPSSRPKPVSVKSYPPHLPLHLQDDNDTMITFPSTSRQYRHKEPLETIHLNTAPAFSENQNRPRKTSNPRSRAPSLRSTPASRRNYVVHAKVTTPTVASFRPQMLQRSSSHGVAMAQTGSWGSMSVPKSAKKWARTAHLHEVKTPRVLFPPTTSALAARRSKKMGDDISPTRHNRDQERTPRDAGSDRENEGFFSFATKQAVNGKQPVAGSMPPPDSSLLFAKAEDDGDPWVDSDTTSIDGTEGFGV